MAKWPKRVAPLKKRMEQTDRVRITGVDTDLSFSIKRHTGQTVYGTSQHPDGECFTAPVKDSVNGHIHFNVPTIYRGTTFSDIKLTFQSGKIIHATSNNTDKLNDILDTDAGARYIGEFAIAFNPYITSPMLDILFDEKISGSFHFTPGNAIPTTQTTAIAPPYTGTWYSSKPRIRRWRNLLRRRVHSQRRAFCRRGPQRVKPRKPQINMTKTEHPMQTLTLSIKGMSCAACVARVEDTLKNRPWRRRCAGQLCHPSGHGSSQSRPDRHTRRCRLQCRLRSLSAYFGRRRANRTHT